jgi:spermidine/putrescine transport system permease protein
MTAYAADAPRGRAAARAWAFVRRHTLTVYASLALLYLMLPIAVVVLFSFNDPVGRFNYTWEGFTLDHWRNPFGVPGIQESITTSLQIAALASLAATALGTLIALALVRYAFRGRGPTNVFIFLPMTTPEVVLGFWTIFLAHVMFNISFVVVTVRARIVGFDRHLEEAAMDLGANEWTTFWRVTVPLIAPGIVAGALIAFALSVDDFVITNFNAGATVTFPLYVWGAARIGVPPQVNVIGTAIFAVAVTLMLANILIQRRKESA